jgi:dihydrofolate reductase
MAREVVFVVARADNGVIARRGQVPWRNREDLQRFVGHTMGTPMIMGRKTFDSFPQPLKGRRHIVLTRNPPLVGPGRGSRAHGRGRAGAGGCRRHQRGRRG